jgi:hypothetical protein
LLEAGDLPEAGVCRKRAFCVSSGRLAAVDGKVTSTVQF